VTEETRALYKLIRSNRKTIELRITLTGELEVRAPQRMAQREIDQFVKQKEAWIAAKQPLMLEKQRAREAFALGFGQALLYMGTEYVIRPTEEYKAYFRDGSFYCWQDADEPNIRFNAEKIYRRQAGHILKVKTMQWARTMQLAPPASVRITGAKTRWGSCSSRRTINYSWYLMMASEATIDYVVIHELSHLTEMNHSPRFWEIVARYKPDYLDSHQELKALELRLHSENWY
jgi:predicted metal-dependent hydrolase